jgi:hypothetical protein
LLVPPPARAQSAADSAAIRATALDYIEGWFQGAGDRVIVNVLWENRPRP